VYDCDVPVERAFTPTSEHLVVRKDEGSSG
jgi:hypothetical protein